MKKREVGQVSFSMTDNYEKSLWDHAAKQGVFSKYIKRLIAQDMEKEVSVTQIMPTTKTVGSNDGDKEAAKGFL